MKRALCVAVGRYNPANPRPVQTLNGPVSDEHHVGLSTKALSYAARIVADPRAYRGNVEDRLRWLREIDHESNSSYVLALSMHGSQFQNRTGDELDGLDEVSCLYDRDPSMWWSREGMIVDNEWGELLPHAPGLVLFDMCHQGSGLKLLNPEHRIIQRAIAPPPDVAFRGLVTPAPATTVEAKLRAARRPIAYLGASLDHQTAADYMELSCPFCAQRPAMLIENGTLNYHGALSMAFLSTLWAAAGAIFSPREVTFAQRPELTFNDLKAGIEKWFVERPHFSQTPSLELFDGDPSEVLALCR